MNDDTWNLIEDSFRRWPSGRASPVSAIDFELAMQPFASLIDPNYREFVLRFGGGLVGSYPIYGLRMAEDMGTKWGKGTSPELTRAFIEQKWKGVDDWLIFSLDYGGNPVGFTKSGTVWLSDQTDFPQICQIADNFEDYLLKWCLRKRKVTNYPPFDR